MGANIDQPCLDFFELLVVRVGRLAWLASDHLSVVVPCKAEVCIELIYAAE